MSLLILLLYVPVDLVYCFLFSITLTLFIVIYLVDTVIDLKKSVEFHNDSHMVSLFLKYVP